MNGLTQKANLTGTGVALITPFKSDLSVDTDALRALVNYCIEGGIDYMVALGTTAEVVTLSKEEKNLVRETIISENRNRLPLVVGVGGNNTMELVRQLKEDKLNGFDAVLSVSPYYNKPTQEGIYQHFVALADVSDKPIILYNVPGRTGSDMSAETIIRLAKSHSNIIGVKEASGDLQKIAYLIEQAPRDFNIISGDDQTALATVAIGGAGVISVLGQGIPEIFTKMIRLGLDGKVKKAESINTSIAPLVELIFREGNPAGIKALLEFKAIGSSTVRLPLVEATSDLKREIQQGLERIEMAESLEANTENS